MKILFRTIAAIAVVAALLWLGGQLFGSPQETEALDPATQKKQELANYKAEYKKSGEKLITIVDHFQENLDNVRLDPANYPLTEEAQSDFKRVEDEMDNYMAELDAVNVPTSQEDKFRRYYAYVDMMRECIQDYQANLPENEDAIKAAKAFLDAHQQLTKLNKAYE